MLGMFIGYIIKRDKNSREYHAEQVEIQRQYHKEQMEIQRDYFQKMHLEHLYARKESRDAMQYNTKAHETNSSAIDKNSHATEDLARAIDRLIQNSNHHNHK